MDKFFYSVANSDTLQLIYKQYNFKGKVAENNSFRQQLLLDVKTPETNVEDIQNISYNQGELIKYFE